MKLKSLLIGSAAAMVAVSGAKAADAIVVEPEPMEYVKVCDMYGAGYFYIPGTETCLKLGGYVRLEYKVNGDHGDGTISDHDWRARAHLVVDAKNETEYGTLGSRIVFRMQRDEEHTNHDDFSTTDGFDSSYGLIKGTINIAGFRAGFDADSGGAQNRYAGYGFYNAVNDGSYGFDTAMFFEYGGTVGDWSYVIGAQDSVYSGAAGQPDPYIGISGSVGDLSIGAVAIYDHEHAGIPNSGGVYYKVRGDYDMSSMIPGGSLGAWWRADGGETDYVKGHQWGVTMKANITDSLIGYAGYADYSADPVTNAGNSQREWTAGVQWNVASGLYVRTEYAKFLPESGQTNSQVVVRVQRSF